LCPVSAHGGASGLHYSISGTLYFGLLQTSRGDELKAKEERENTERGKSRDRTAASIKNREVLRKLQPPQTKTHPQSPGFSIVQGGQVKGEEGALWVFFFVGFGADRPGLGVARTNLKKKKNHTNPTKKQKNKTKKKKKKPCRQKQSKA